MEDLQRANARGHRLRRGSAAVGMTLVLGAGFAAGCGSSGSDSDTTAAAPAAPAPAATTPAPAATTTPAPTTTTAKLTFEAKQAHKGTMRLAALPIGWKGGHIDVVKPKGLADPDVAGYYYFKQGTTVKLRVRATGKAQFAQWAGACAGTQRTCTVKMNDVVRVLAGFLPKKGTKTT